MTEKKLKENNNKSDDKEKRAKERADRKAEKKAKTNKYTFSLSTVYTRIYAEAEKSDGEKKNNLKWKETANWIISNKKTKQDIATIQCYGVNENKELEISYEIVNEEDFVKHFKEGMKELINVFFSFESEINYVILKEKAFSKTEKNANAEIGFVEEKPGFWVYQRPKSNWLATYMCCGIALGTIYGYSNNHYIIGMLAGVSIGTAIGAILDAALRFKLNKQREEHNERYGIIDNKNKKAEKTDSK